jgi:D-3-phosphoglycerate dehydrogenase / 2-oxoglutarate reductase
LVRLVPGCSGWIAGVEPITARVFEAADRLKAISRNGTGIDAIDMEAARRRGVKVLTATGANARAVAELTLAFILSGLRQVSESAIALRAGLWRRSEGREIGGATIGVYGCGAIGREVSRMACALGAKVLASDIKVDTTFAPAGDFHWADRHELLAHSDVVTLHCPALASGRPILDRDTLARMRRGAGVVNTARASLVDEEAVLEALESGRTGWFATDVFAVEPPPPSPLLSHPRVIATPHIGGFTTEGGRQAISVAVDMLLRELGMSGPGCG